MSHKMVTPVKTNRKSSKPMMEKRRRARINQSLAELKDLIVCCNKYKLQNCRRTKLEKADILELTVRHLHRLHEKKHTEKDGKLLLGCPHHEVKEKYCAGFHECVQEIHRYLNNNDDITLDKSSQIRLFEHLQSHLRDLNTKGGDAREASATNSRHVPQARDSGSDITVPRTAVNGDTEAPSSTAAAASNMAAVASALEFKKLENATLKRAARASHVAQDFVVSNKQNIIKMKLRANPKLLHQLTTKPDVIREDVWRPW